MWIARCHSGFQVVYKPKSLAVDRHFQELLGWLNERGMAPPFRQLRILDRGNYGWEEFVAPSGCSSKVEVAGFYRREGGFLALLHALAAADFHYENLIAAGEHPVLIDLEALFHPRGVDDEPLEADLVAGNCFGECVLGSGLLPQRFWQEAHSAWSDLSGMGAEAGTPLPWRPPMFTGLGTDEMCFARGADRIASSDHRPTLDGATVQPLDYVTEIETGFRHVYQLLEKHRGELLAAGGPLQRCAGDEVRVLFRATSRYREFLDEGFHPDVLRDALDRDRLFDRLWNGLQDQPQRRTQLIPAEVLDLWRGDIPHFTTRPGSCDLWGSAGQRFVDVFHETGIERVRRRLGQFGAEDFARQLWFLRASLTTQATGADAIAHPGYHLVEGRTPADRERMLAACRAVGDRLAERALHGAGDATWIGLSLVREEQWSLLPLGMDLYDGVPGVTLFLAYLGAITGEESYTALGRAALKTLRRRLLPHKRHKTIRGVGGFAGWGGVLYTLAHLGVLWDNPQLLAEARELVTVLPDLIERDRDLDIVGGAAGCIAGLLCLHACVPSPQALAVAVQCGDHLVARARPMPQGLAWDPPFPSRGPLTGFSHGAAGIAWTLLELAAQTGASRFRSAALGGIAYERSLFSAEAANWPDLRLFGTPAAPGDGAPLPCHTAWCHGAPGIGLARLGCLPHLEDPLLGPEIDAALRTTLANGFGHNHTLCHGDLGNLEFLLRYAQTFPGSDRRAEVDRLGAGILNSITGEGWLCANPLGLESPGLMTGIAGIGYGLLRLAEPERVPSVLTLAPPPAVAAENTAPKRRAQHRGHFQIKGEPA